MASSSKEFQAFTSLVNRLLTVPKAVVDERLAAHREQSDANPRKRGPKPKAKSSTSGRDRA